MTIQSITIATLIACVMLLFTFSCDLLGTDAVLGSWSIDSINVVLLGKHVKLAFSEIEAEAKCPLENPIIFKSDNTFSWQLKKWNSTHKRCDLDRQHQDVWRKTDKTYTLKDGNDDITLTLENNFLVWVVDAEQTYYFKKE